MKKNYAFRNRFDWLVRILFLMAAVLLCQTSLFSQETEPNNTAAQANYFAVNATMTAEINPQNDEDWFKITISEEGTLKIKAVGSTIGDFYIRLIDVDTEEVLAWDEAYPLTDTAKVSKTNLQAGTYYVRVFPYSSNQGLYSVSNEFIPALLPNDDEPNNTAEEANTFAINSTTTGRLNYVYDNVGDVNDWYKITIPEEGTLKVFSTSPDDNDYYIQLIDIDEERVLSNDEAYPLTDTAKVSKTNLQAGTYYVRVYPYSSNHGSYYLINEFIPALLPNDDEPNNTVEEANTFALNSTTTGRLNYVYDNVGDVNDWYEITIPEEGTLKIFSTSPDHNDYYIQLIDVDAERVLSTGEAYPISDTAKVGKTNLQAGTYYVRVYPYSSNHGSYYLINEYTPALLPNDDEPNNTAAEANTFTLNSTTTGRLNYVYDNVGDINDWYKITIPEEGTLKVVSASPDDNDYYIQLIDVDIERVLSNDEAYPLTDTARVSKANLQAGTYYVRVYPYSSNHGSYYLINEFIPALLPNDAEPNNTAALANLISTDTALTGRLNYVLDGVGDTYDWYKFTITQPGGIKVVTTSPDNYDYYITLYGPDSSSVLASDNVYPLGDIGTVYGWGLEVGQTYFIRINPYSAYFGSYTLNVEFQPAPIPDFEADQSLMYVLFTNTSQYGLTYHWDFGDGTTSTQVNPSHTYNEPGAFEVTLTASNPNGDNEYSNFVQFRGVQKVEGQHGGNGGESTVTVHAGGLVTESNPLLRKGSTEISGTDKIFPNVGQVQSVYDLTGAELGLYDVVVKNPGEVEMVLPEAYIVEESNEPEIYVELIGRDRALINRWSTYTVEFGNKGNTDAYYQILWLAVPDSIEFKNLEFDLSLYNDPEAEAYLADCPPYWELDTLDNVPFNGRLYGIPFDRVPADSKYSIEFKIKAVEDFQISVFSTNPWFEVDDFDKTMSYNECVAWAIATMIRDKLVEQLTGLIPGADCIYGSVKTLSEVTLKYTEGKLTVPSLGWNLVQVFWTCLKDLGVNLSPIKALKVSKVVIDITIDIVNSYNADQDCQKFKKKDSKDKLVAAVTSLDPNEIVGPAGFKDENYITDTEAAYTIYFENKNTAMANAVEVFIWDTIDVSRFDMASFAFNNIWFSGNNYEVVEDGDGFGLDIDLRPALNTIVRVHGTIDREKGIAYWHFLSLDPITMDITEDPDAGFLPPNNAPPEGEGFVSYDILMKETLVHDEKIEARAEIVFDFNPPILTNTYSNKIDRKAPVSSVYDIQPTGEENLYRVFWHGTDNESGIGYYDIYMAEGNGDYTLWNSNNENESDTIRVNSDIKYKFFAMAHDKLGNQEPYKGYPEEVLGIDDFETYSYTLEIIPNPVVDQSMIKYSVFDAGNVSISIYNPVGQIIKLTPERFHTPGTYEVPLESSGLSKGIYMVSVSGDGGTVNGKFVVK